MRLRFRPLASFTAFALPMFALLVGLGVRQLERLQWKLALIAQIRHNVSAEPISLDAAAALGEHAQYRRVVLSGRLDSSREVYVYTTGPDGAPVYHILAPLMLPDGRAMIVDRGYIPTRLRDPGLRPGSEPEGDVRVIGIWRRPDGPGPFTPAPDLRDRVWFARDLAGIAKAEHIKLAAPALLEATALPGSHPWPHAGQTRIDIPNDHLQYALTWFLLAGALLVVYLSYHRARDRLEFGDARSAGKNRI